LALAKGRRSDVLMEAVNRQAQKAASAPRTRNSAAVTRHPKRGEVRSESATSGKDPEGVKGCSNGWSEAQPVESPPSGDRSESLLLRPAGAREGRPTFHRRLVVLRVLLRSTRSYSRRPRWGRERLQESGGLLIVEGFIPPSPGAAEGESRSSGILSRFLAPISAIEVGRDGVKVRR
jgi:hypothetical protein